MRNAAVGGGANWILKAGFPNSYSGHSVFQRKLYRSSLLQEICYLVIQLKLCCFLVHRGESPQRQSYIPYVTLLTKTGLSGQSFPPSPVGGRAMWPGVGVEPVLPGVSQATCDPHGHLTIGSKRDKTKPSGLKLVCRAQAFTESVERSANQLEVENNSSK